jgi:hypothetical protein
MFRPSSVLAAVLAALGLAGCAAGRACPRDRTCGTAAWVNPSGAAPLDGPLYVAVASQIAGATAVPGVERERVPVGRRPVLLRFDVAALQGRTIERAVLALSPHPSWRPGGRPVQLFAHAITGRWPRGGIESGASLGADPVAEAVLPGRTRTPLRLDVTRALQAWQTGVAPFEGLALSSDGEEVVLVGTAATEPGDRPRLEVVLR